MSLVSLIVPCYNVIEAKLKRMISSVLAQDYDKIEIILVDDGSTDDTRKRLANHQLSLIERGYDSILLHKNNGGIASAINTGLKHCNGDFICFPDADDTLEVSYVSEMVTFFEKHQEYEWVRCEAAIVTNNNITNYIRLPDDYIPEKAFLSLLTHHIAHVVWNMMIKKEFFNKCIPDNMLYESQASQEWQIMLPLTYSAPFGFINKVLYNYYIYEDSHFRQNTGTDSAYKKYNDMVFQNALNTLIKLPIPRAEFSFYYDLFELGNIKDRRLHSESSANECAASLSALYAKYTNDHLPKEIIKRRFPCLFYANKLTACLLGLPNKNAFAPFLTEVP